MVRLFWGQQLLSLRSHRHRPLLAVVLASALTRWAERVAILSSVTKTGYTSYSGSKSRSVRRHGLCYNSSSRGKEQD